MISAAVSYTTEAHLSVPGIDVEVLSFRQPEPFTGEFGSERHSLSMSLTPLVTCSRGAYVDADGRPGEWHPVGDVSFCPGGTRLAVMAPGGVESYRGIYCSFDADVFERTTGLGDGWTPAQLAAALDIQSPTIKRGLYRIVQEVSEPGYHRDKLVEITAQLVLAEFTRYLHDLETRPTSELRPALAGWQMRRIRDYVDGMIDHCPTIDELARVCEIGRRHLTRAFKATTGRTIGEYVAEVRMTKARSLLVDTELSQKEIAYRLGFAGPSSFCATFGRSTGMTPNQYRRTHRRA